MRCEECRQEFVEESPRDLLALYFHLMLEHGFIGLLSRKKGAPPITTSHWPGGVTVRQGGNVITGIDI